MKKRNPGWGLRAPKTTSERRAALARFGRRAFLDPSGLRYPVMSRSGHLDAEGVLAAYKRAAQQHEPRIRAKAKALGRRMRLDWARRNPGKLGVFFIGRGRTVQVRDAGGRIVVQGRLPKRLKASRPVIMRIAKDLMVKV